MPRNPATRKRNAWSYIDARDLGEIVHLCLQKDGLGFQVFNATNDTATLNEPTHGIPEARISRIRRSRGRWASARRRSPTARSARCWASRKRTTGGNVTPEWNVDEQPRLAGKVALITGAAGGIGGATAALFEAEGAQARAHRSRRRPSLARLRRARRADARRRTSPTRRAGARWWMRRSRASAGCDVLVNNAGVAIVGNIETATLAGVAADAGGQRRERVSRLPRGGAGDEGARRLDRQYLLGRRHHRRRAIGRLLREQGRGAARRPNPSRSIARARAMASAATPCIPRSPARRWWRGSSRRRAIPSACAKGWPPPRRWGAWARPAEVAAAILYLASDESSFTTGAEIVVDGGLTAQ